MSEKSRKDFWDKAQVFATFFLGLVGLVFTYVLQSQQEQNRVSHVTTQIMSQREQSEMEFRGKMFDTMLAKLLNADASLTERVNTLRLFQQNFHDAFNGRAFFDVLAAEAGKLTFYERKEVLKELNSLAMEISRIQESIIESNFDEKHIPNFQVVVRKETRDLPTFWISEYDSAIVNITYGKEEKHESQHSGLSVFELFKSNKKGHLHPHRIIVKFDLVKSDNEIQVKLRFDTDPPKEYRTFEVSYFDTPFTDNTILPDGHRIAIILKDTNFSKFPRKAKLKIVEFPANYILSGYRPSLNKLNDILAGQH